MGSPLSPVMANFFMDDCDKEELNKAEYKPMCWFQHVSNMFIVCPHGPEKLDDFLYHLNSNNPNIQFTMKTELDGYLPFLDTDKIRWFLILHTES
jgi:hypothetical protein